VPFDQAPARDEDLATELTPCLTLVAPAGMTKGERTLWLHAAARALDGIPLDLLRKGCDAALKLADHPSKIVATIYRTIEPDLERRRREAGIAPRPLPLPRPDETEEERQERLEVRDLMAGLGKRLAARATEQQAYPKGR
jgi:hypothetical protein